MSDTHEDTQNQRLRDLEKRMTSLENQGAALLAKLDTISQFAKLIVVLVGGAMGIEISALM